MAFRRTQSSYEIKKYERHPKTMLAPPELTKIHPLGKSPVITDGSNTVAESGAIIEYLVNKYGNGRLKPSNNSAQEIRYNYWLHYAEGSFMFPLVLSLIFGSLPKQPAPFFIKPSFKIQPGLPEKNLLQLIFSLVSQ